MARTLLLSKDRNDPLLEEAQREVETESLRDILVYRYGYRPPETKWKATTDEGRLWTQGGRITKLYRLLGHWDRQDNLTKDGLTTEELEPLADFVVMVKQGRVPPHEISDLSDVAGHPLSQPSTRGLRVSRYELGTEISAPVSWYMLRLLNGVALDTSGRCRMLIDMATNVLHIQREQFGDSADTILESLLHRGIHVRLLRAINTTDNIARPREWISTLGDRPLGIGIKPHGVELTREDYKVYMRMRDELLRGPAGCAALLEGGILWRLSWSICSIEETMKGPDLDDINAHRYLRISTIGGQNCAESVLSQQDQYTIVGVYRVLQCK
ncbi:hypothetical protein BDY19DRAFT_993576 [Irpex rosettiformis]|uniref:Uncharacterized protein n=1 Tax=Irpex rosettiformis TaxID=378272 RepID=A0ACB8U517_9APHY|nr:hypothetical protein BDY19DRAFT_993576 [Irpex rosettiformis]